ncbi:MAG: hypothetical protein QOF16_1168 [Actinomycetota bacterium]|jgi:hypothetical protein|nr:hypothetical protein [Actinomycetota bacterium]MEA2487514.1 hypothetical protein [Actinomycetota bacterium]
MNRLSRNEQLFAGAGLLLFILSFIKLWATYKGHVFTAFTVHISAWDYGFLLKVGIIVALAGAVAVILKAVGVKFDLPGVAYMIAGIFVGADMLLYVLVGPPDAGGLADESRGILLFVALVLGIVMAYAGWMINKEQPTTAGPASPASPAAPPAS